MPPPPRWCRKTARRGWTAPRARCRKRALSNCGARACWSRRWSRGGSLLGDTRVTLLGIDPLTAPPGTAAALADGDLQGFLSGAAMPIPKRWPDRRDRHGARALASRARGHRAGRYRHRANRFGHDRPDQPPVADRPRARPLPDGLRLSQPEAGAELDGLTDSFHLNLTAFRRAGLRGGPVHRAFRRGAGVRAAPRAVPHPAQPWRVVAGADACAGAGTGAVRAGRGLAGLVLGYVMAAALLPDVAATLRGPVWRAGAGQPAIQPGLGLAGLGMAFAGAGLAGGQALWRLWHMPVLAPAQPRAWAMASGRAMRWQMLGAGLLAGLAVALGLSGRACSRGSRCWRRPCWRRPC